MGHDVTRSRIPIAGHSLSLHGFLPRGDVAGVVFYCHGLQSHAGWLFETGPALAERGVALYALDRRGCGASEGPIGQTPEVDELLAAYRGALESVHARHAGRTVVVFGQSFGGALATLLACESPDLLGPLVVAAPALDQARSTRQLQSAPVMQDGNPLVAVPFRDEWYTDDPRYLAFMAGDQRMLREFHIRGHVATVRAMAARYVGAGTALASRTTYFIRGIADPIIDLDVAAEAFDRLTAGRAVQIRVPAMLHYLEFSPCRHFLWAFLHMVATEPGLATDLRSGTNDERHLP